MGCPLLLPPFDLSDRAVDFLGDVDAPGLPHDTDVCEHPFSVLELVPCFGVLDTYVCWPGQALAELVLGAVDGEGLIGGMGWVRMELGVGCVVCWLAEQVP